MQSRGRRKPAPPHRPAPSLSPRKLVETCARLEGDIGEPGRGSDGDQEAASPLPDGGVRADRARSARGTGPRLGRRRLRHEHADRPVDHPRDDRHRQPLRRLRHPGGAALAGAGLLAPVRERPGQLEREHPVPLPQRLRAVRRMRAARDQRARQGLHPLSGRPAHGRVGRRHLHSPPRLATEPPVRHRVAHDLLPARGDGELRGHLHRGLRHAVRDLRLEHRQRLDGDERNPVLGPGAVHPVLVRRVDARQRIARELRADWRPAAATTTAAAASTSTASATSAAATTATAAATSATSATAAASAYHRLRRHPPPPARCRVPRVLGLRLGNARQRIRRARCSVGRVRRVRTRRSLRGRVVGQSPRPGAVRRRGFPVNLLVGRR